LEFIYRSVRRLDARKGWLKTGPAGVRCLSEISGIRFPLHPSGSIVATACLSAYSLWSQKALSCDEGEGYVLICSSLAAGDCAPAAKHRCQI